MHRRSLFAAVAALTVAAQVSSPVGAQAYPTRPIRIVVPFAAGGTTDILARLVTQKMTDRLGWRFVIENVTGATGNVGTASVARAEPDGYTLVMGTSATHAINPSLFPKLSYNVLRDFEPVAYVAGVPNVMVVGPSVVRATNVAEFVAEARAAREPLTYASTGAGASVHLSGELFKLKTGVNLTHVPYRGSSPALTDLMGGQVHVMFDNLPSAIEFVRAGSLRPLAVTSAQRSPALPDVPTLIEAGLDGFDLTGWFALFAPSRTPPAIIERFNGEVRKALSDPDLARRVADLGGELKPLDAPSFKSFVAAEIEKWAPIVKASGAAMN